MFLDFTVENYRSIKEPVTLSAVAQKSSFRQAKTTGKRQGIKPDHEIAPGYHIDGWDIDILPVLAIFGANASGKSNVIQALNYLLFLMIFGYQKSTYLQQLIKQPKLDSFKLNAISSVQPTKFELRTIFDGDIYTYSLVINKNHIFSERLTYIPVKTKRSRLLFDRYQEDDTNKITWKIGAAFTGSHTQLKDSISNNDLFINILLKLTVNIIKPFNNWMHRRWHSTEIGNDTFDSIYIRISQILDEPLSDYLIKRVLRILQKFDTGLSNIIIEPIPKTSDYKIYAVHKTHDNDEIRWLFDEESLGTQRLFTLAYRIVVILEVGSLLIIDELTANLHPNIVKYIIKIFQNSKANPKNAQLIFTSHDNTLQRNNLLRRDQIWFTQKRPDHSTELYPLTDFHVRNDLAIDKAYLDGRFGAVPFLPEDEEMILQDEE